MLPCKYCRINLKSNFKKLPLRKSVFKSRDSLSRYVYNLHETVNKMLGKKSGLTYEDVKLRYEMFRARCLTKKPVVKKKTKKESGCVKPLYGTKSKCIISIVPKSKKCNTFNIDKQCILRKN